MWHCSTVWHLRSLCCWANFSLTHWSHNVWILKSAETTCGLNTWGLVTCGLRWGSSCELSVHFLLKKTYLVVLLEWDIRARWIGVQNVHSFKIQSTNTSHESLLQVFLHTCLCRISNCNLLISVLKSCPKHFNFFAIIGTNWLYFVFHCSLEIFFIFFYFPYFIVFLPCFKYSPCSFFFVPGYFVSDHYFWMFLKFFVLFELHEASEHNCSHSSKSLALIRPERKKFTPHGIFVCSFGLCSEVFSQIF